MWPSGKAPVFGKKHSGVKTATRQFGNESSLENLFSKQKFGGRGT